MTPNKQPKKPRSSKRTARSKNAASSKKPASLKEPVERKKSRAKSFPVPVEASSATLELLNPNAAGIDVHSNMHMVCVPANRDQNPVRQFGANTIDLEAIAAWLQKCGVTTVAMESTGVYWIPLFELLESKGFQVHLIEPGQLSRCGARPKTDVLDAQWIQRLHSYGLLRASFRPPDCVMALRAFVRVRQMQLRYAAGHLQHMQKALEQMNVKLPEVVRDITGLTGLSIIDAILAGERDPYKLAKLRNERCKRTEAEIALALQGNWRREHLFELRQARELFRFHHQQITECDKQIKAELASLSDRAGEKTRAATPRKCGRKRNDLRFAAKDPLFRALGVDLTLVDGIEEGTAMVILAEIGADVSRFPTEKHFASWLRLCPHQHESNNTKRRRGPRKGASRLTTALRLAARAVGRSNTPLGSFYRRIRSRIGGLGAVKATAHKLACLIYRMLKYGEEFATQSMKDYEAKIKANAVRALQRKAAAMGYELSPTPNP